MDGARVYYAKRNKSEKDKYMISLMCLRNKTDEYIGREGREERETNHKRLNNRE